VNDVVRAKLAGIIAVAGVLQLAFGVWMAVAPANFFRVLGGFGAENVHYVRDVSTIFLAVGVVLLLAAGRPAWRRPVLLVVALQYVAHAVNHLADIGAGDPRWIGPFDFALIARNAALFFSLFVLANEGTR
jgi:hypothetical protein